MMEASDGIPADYEVLEVLGRGGFARVFRARQRSLGREVALKLLYPSVAADEEARARFRRELHVAARLSHPNLVRVLDGDSAEGGAFLAMELVRGGSLASRIAAGPLDWDQAAHILKQVLEGLTYLHSHGIVHRDLKPANIMLTEDGTAKLGDFGLVFVDTATALTGDGQVVGTLAFAPPEVLIGHPAGPEADLWSLGVTLRSMLTGRPLFETESLQEWCGLILSRRWGPLVPARGPAPPMATEIDQMLMDPEPASRLASRERVGALLEELTRRASVSATRTPQTSPPRAPSPARRKSHRVAAALGLSILAALLVLRWKSGQEDLDAQILAIDRLMDPSPADRVEGLARDLLQRHPGSIPVLTRLGVFLLSRGRLEEAETLVAPVSRGTRHPGLISLLFALHEKAGRFDEALEVADRLRDQDPARAHHLRGVALKRLNRLEEAESEWREALRIAPAIEGAACQLGLLLVESRRTEEALTVLGEQIARGAPSGEVFRIRAFCHSARGDRSAALDDFRAAAKLEPWRDDHWQSLQEAATLAGRADVALEALEARRRPGRPEPGGP